MKATRFPLRIFPSNKRVCSNDEVTNEIKDNPSAFNANNITPTKIVIAPRPR